MLHLKRFKEAVVSYDIHSHFGKQMLNLWSLCHRIISKDYTELVKDVLELGPHL